MTGALKALVGDVDVTRVTDLVHRFGPAVATTPSPAPSVDHEDIQALMAPGSSVRTLEPETASPPESAAVQAPPPNVYTPEAAAPAAADPVAADPVAAGPVAAGPAAASPNVYVADDEPQLPRTPNVYAALENLDAEHEQAIATAAAVEEVPRADRDAEWSAMGAGTEAPDWTAMGAEPVGGENLRWRREDDDIVPSGAVGGRRLPRLSLRRR